MTTKILIIIATLVLSFPVFSQEDRLQVQLDSILLEADLLFNYEKVAWNASDLFTASDVGKTATGGYIIYHKEDMIYASFLDQAIEKVIAYYTFSESDLANTQEFSYEGRTLTKLEQELFNKRSVIINQLNDPKYQITIPQGYSPNVVLFKIDSGYRMYIIMGTSQPDVIPLGNDFMFETDQEGNINKWQKFHSHIIPAQSTTGDGHKVISAIHSHLKSTPLITATDICTFRLYADINGMQSFMVLSTALGKYFNYDKESNTITITTP